FVKGELDWIVLKALAKDRDRRYETVNGLMQDIERFLNHEPASAGPPSARYRFRKFVQRNRQQVIAGRLVLLALLAGIAGPTTGLIWAHRLANRGAWERQKAIAARAIALQAVEDMWVGVAERWLEDEPGLEQTQREFMQKALVFYERLAGEEGDNPAFQ